MSKLKESKSQMNSKFQMKNEEKLAEIEKLIEKYKGKSSYGEKKGNLALAKRGKRAR